MAQDQNKQLQTNSSNSLKTRQQLEDTGIIKAFKSGGSNLTKFQASLTCATAIEGISISLTKKVHPEALEAVTDVLMVNMFKYVTVGKTFEPEMMPLIQQAVFKKYYYLTIEEYAYVLRCGASGDYGKIYDRIDLPVIMGWFEFYDTKERTPLVEKMKHNESVDSAKALDKSAEMIAKYVLPLIEEIETETIASKQQEQEKENEYQKLKLISLMNRKKFIDKDGKETKI